MLLSKKFRLYPSNQQEKELEKHLELCRQVYNHFLEQLNDSDEIPSEYEAKNQLPQLKNKWEEIKQVHSKVLQTTVEQLYSNLKGLSEKKKNGYQVGRLRFKGKGWFKTFRYNQSGFNIKKSDTSIRRDTLWLSKIGDIPIRLHRNITGNLKGIIVKRTSSGKWFAILQVEENFNPKPVQGEKKAVGIDLGTLNYAVDSTGRAIGNPRNVEKAEDRLAKAQQDLHRKEKGSENREKNRVRVAKLHEEVQNRRKDFLHKLSTAYIQNYDIICVEDLNVAEMVENSRYAKNNLDASWRTFTEMLMYKAEKAGTETEVVKVDPENTTKNCTDCGETVPKPLWQRLHECPNCGCTCDRDYNAALNILRRGLEKLDLGKGQPEDTPVDTDSLLDEDLRRIPAKSVVEAGSSVLTEARQGLKVRAE